MTNPASHGRPALRRDRVHPGLLVVPHFPDRLRAANDDGRTPRINGGAGRGDHPNAWSVVLGAGIRGGQTVSRTDADGGTVEGRPVSVPD